LGFVKKGKKLTDKEVAFFFYKTLKQIGLPCFSSTTMEQLGKPVKKFDQMSEVVKKMLGTEGELNLSFEDTQIAFADRSDKELKKMAWLFGLMNNHWLVGIGSKIGLAAIKMHLPFVQTVVKNTIFEQFCGGTSLEDSKKTIKRLHASGISSFLDYGAEAKEEEAEMDFTMQENIRCIEFASTNPGAPIISIKITGMSRFEFLENIQKGIPLDADTKVEYKNLLRRLDGICAAAAEKGVSVFVDAEESWIQDTIDHLAEMMMKRYNAERPVVYTTCQMYRHDRLKYLHDLFERSQREGYVLGVKLVRGAYMEKERERAADLGYTSPIQASKADTDRDFNTAVQFCLDNYEKIAVCNASHNAESAMLQARLIAERKLDRKHPHLLFCQLQGMSDNLTYNLAAAGFNSAKYVVYGSVRDVVPYLIRRAQENSSVTGDMSREYSLVAREMKRRGLDA
jgi:proline dehydrogenase